MSPDERDPWIEDDLDVVGTDVARLDAADKVRGNATFTADVRLPRQAVGVFVRSPFAHGRVVSLEIDEALSLDGVLAVFTPGHCHRPETDGPEDVALPSWYAENAPFLATVARYVGDEVALVVATDRATARSAAEHVRIEWEERPHVVDPEDALDNDAPLVHDDRDDNLTGPPEHYGRGDVDEALAAAAHVIRRTFHTPTQVHNALESHGAVADWNADGLTIWSSTQGINDVREGVADAFDLDHSRVRVICEHIGGGFGAKQVPWKPTVAAAVASRQLGRPVMVMNERREENISAGKRNSTVQTVTLASDDEGNLVAIDLDVIVDNGAYSVGGEGSNVAGPSHYLYRCENVRTRTRRTYTNTGPAVAFRAPGYVESTFVLESAIDELSEVLGTDQIEMRRRNLAKANQLDGLPWSSPEALPTALDRLSSIPEPKHDAGLLYGRGVALGDWMAATANPPGTAWAEFNVDGSVHVSTSVQDIGTGTRTMLAMVAAEELGIPVERIRVSVGDTTSGPLAPTSAGSTTAPTMAPAVREAAAGLRDQLLSHAAQHLQIAADQLEIHDDTVVAGTGERLETAQLLAALEPETIRASGQRIETASEVSPRAQTGALVDLTIDPGTGEVRIVQVVVAPDCGRIIDPRTVDSQVFGGATQGIGFALTEEQPFDPNLGTRPDAGLETYHVPTIGDVPNIVHEALDIPDLAANSLGVKGIGELPMIPVPAAIAIAASRAVGHRFDRLPLNRSTVITALAGADERRSTAEESTT